MLFVTVCKKFKGASQISHIGMLCAFA